MRRISSDDELLIIRVIDECPARNCSWEAIREELAKSLGGLEKVWSRQALKAHPAIYSKYEAKILSRRVGKNGTASAPTSAATAESSEPPAEETPLQELQRKYDALALQHRQLMYNASLLPGGLRLMVDPLPVGQQEGRSSRSGRNGSGR